MRGAAFRAGLAPGARLRQDRFHFGGGVGHAPTAAGGGAEVVKRVPDGRIVLSPGLADAPVLDRLCTHFVLTLTLAQAGRFNPRRDWSGLLGLTGRHLVWPLAVLHRLRAFLQRR